MLDDFDNRMCGKWKSEIVKIGRWCTQIFINIEHENNDVKIYFNFDWAIFNNSAFYVETSYNSLYFFHNDRKNRMEYILTVDENNCNKLMCNLTVKHRNFEEDIEFTRLTQEEENKYSHKIMFESKNSSRFELLREFSEYSYDESESNINFEYRFDERENMLDIIEKYNLDDIVRGKNDVETSITLMNWLCDRYKHGPYIANKRTPQALMDDADKNGCRSNCRGLSIILAHLIRAYNIKAFHLSCLPYEDPFDECHVIVSVYCESLSKWIMLDPSFNLYIKNKNGDFIGVDEFRSALINDEKLFESDNMSAAWIDSFDDYREYMAKNLIRLERGIVERYGCDEDGGYFVLIPEKYMKNEAKYFSEGWQKYFITSKKAFWQI